MADRWTLRGVPENTQARARRAAEQSGISTGELVTECINHTLNQKREDQIAAVVSQLADNVESLANSHQQTRQDLHKITGQIRQAGADVARAVYAKEAGVHPKEKPEPKKPTLYELLKAYADVVERNEKRRKRQKKQTIDPDAG